MASYIELLAEDRQRMRQGLEKLIEQQEGRIRELSATLAQYSEVLDRRILRTMIFRNIFGAGQADSLTAEVDTEEASKPVTETTRQLERETQVLKAYRDAVQQLEAGAPLEELGKLPVAAS